MTIFAYYQYINYAYIVGGWVRKCPKTCLRNIWMVPIQKRSLLILNWQMLTICKTKFNSIESDFTDLESNKA